MGKKGKKSKSKSHHSPITKISRPKVHSAVQVSALKRQVTDEITASSEIIDSIRAQERKDTTRKLIKIMCQSLSERYGWGKIRCANLIQWMTDLIEEELAENYNDTGDFWYHIDKALEQKGMNFFPKEDDIKKQGTIG